jgi:hypothetical protein
MRTIELGLFVVGLLPDDCGDAGVGPDRILQPLDGGLEKSGGLFTAMGENLYGLITGRNLNVYPAADLRAQALNTVAVESTRGWRIAKEKSSKKIDGIIALGMACFSAIAALRWRDVARSEPVVS